MKARKWLNDAMMKHDSENDLLIGGSFKDQIEEARKRPKKLNLFGPLIREREITFLYGATGIGKSVLAQQIAISVANAKSLGFEVCETPRHVLLLDFENDVEDLVERVGNADLSNITRVNLNPKGRFKDLIRGLCSNIERLCDEEDCKVVIIDNITWLIDSQDKRNDVSVAADLMKTLKALKDKLELAIVVVAHTPKSKVVETITTAHLYGSSILGNYANAMVALAKGKDGLLYLKQTKSRGCKTIYDAENVLTGQLMKPEGEPLQFFPGDCMAERHALGLEAGGHVTKKERLIELFESGLSREQAIESGVAGKSLTYQIWSEYQSRANGENDSIPVSNTSNDEWNGKTDEA